MSSISSSVDAMETSSGSLLSFLQQLDNDNGVVTSKASSGHSNDSNELHSSLEKLTHYVKGQFYLKSIEVEVSSHVESFYDRKKISADLVPSVAYLDSLSAWKCVFQQSSEDSVLLVESFQRTLLELERDLLAGRRPDYTIVDDLYLDDDTSKISSWKSVSTLIPSVHALISQNMEVLCVLSFTSKLFLSRLTELGVTDIKQIFESLEPQSSKFLSTGGAFASRRKGQSYIVKGQYGLKAVNLAILEVVHELLVGEQQNRPLPLLLSSAYFPTSSRSSVQCSWLQHSLDPVPESSAFHLRGTFIIDGILRVDSISEIVGHVLRHLDNRILAHSGRGMVNPSGRSSSLSGYALLEKVQPFPQSSISSQSLAITVSKPLTALARTSRFLSSERTDLKNPFTSVMARKNESKSLTSLNHSVKNRALSKKRKFYDNEQLSKLLLPSANFRIGWFSKLSAFSMIRDFYFGELNDNSASRNISELVAVKWEQKEEYEKTDLWLTDEILKESEVQLIQKLKYCFKIQNISEID